MLTRLQDPRVAYGLRLVEGRVTRDDLSRGRLLLRQASVATVRSIDKKRREVEVVASTSGVKRDGNAIFHSEKAWDFRNFEKNPAMLWSHDYGSAFGPPGLPLGQWLTWGIEKIDGANALTMRGRFEDDEFPDRVFRRVISGTIRAVSIGWNPLEFEELKDENGRQVGWLFTRNELYECSWVVIGADPDAGVRRFGGGVQRSPAPPSPLGAIAHELERIAAETSSLTARVSLRTAGSRLESVARDGARAVRIGRVERRLDDALHSIGRLIGASR